MFVFLASLVLGFASILISPGAAQASNWGSVCDNSTDCVSQANNAYHAIRYVNLEDEYPQGIPRMEIAADWAVTEFNATDMVVYRTQTDPAPDVELHDYNYGGSVPWVAITRCPTTNTGTGGSHPDRWCRGQQNIYNSYYYWFQNDYYDTDFQRRYVACHEMGHTVALRHSTVSSNSCMWSTLPATSTASILHAHDIAHINARW